VSSIVDPPEAMGAKKRTAVSLSPEAKVSNAGKKARVSETPESIALLKLISAFEGEFSTMLPASVVQMVKSVADKCLLNTVENRDELETTFAKVVGEAVQTGLNGLQKAHKEAIDAVTEEDAKVQELQAALDSANALKEQADKALNDANEAHQRASEKKSDAETELENHVEEENGLQPKKELMVSDLEVLKGVKETVRGPSNVGKRAVNQLQKALKEVEAPPSLIAGIAEAIGKQTPFDQHFVGEAAKLLYDKSAQIEAELEKFGQTVEEYAEKTKALQSKVDQFTTELTERHTELVAAKQKQKDCVAAIKEAEKQKKQGDKSLDKATQFKDEKAAAEGVGSDAEVQYKFLLERSGAVTIDAPETAVEVEAS